MNEWYDSTGSRVFEGSDVDFRLETSAKVFSLDAAESTSDPVVLKYQDHVWGKPTNETIYKKDQERVFFKDIEYKKVILIMWPKRHDFDILLKVSVGLAIKTLHNSMMSTTTLNEKSRSSRQDKVHSEEQEQEQEQTTLRRNFQHLINHLAKYESLETVYENYFNHLFEMLKAADDIEIVEMFVSKLMPERLHQNYSWELAEIIVQFGYDRLKTIVDTMVRPCVEDLIVNCTFILVINFLIYF